MTKEEAYADKLISRSELINKIYDDFDNIDYYSIMRSTGYVTDEQAIECEKAIKERINNDRSLFKS